MKILLTGASGYVGGRLLEPLERAGHSVRCLARKPEYLVSRVGAETEVVRGDVLDPSSLSAAFKGIDAAYYMVHSMGSTGSFEDQDREAAENFGKAAKAAGVKRILYLGGLGDESEALSAHLRSRHETGAVLRESGVPVVEFRASIVIGSGSLSFEMVRALAQKLPVMTIPRWVSVKAQPIGIRDLLEYLVQGLEVDAADSPIFEVGGTDVVSYGDLLRRYSAIRGLKRWLIPVPVLTPKLSSYWLGLVTPLYARVGRKLIDSLKHPTVVRNPSAQTCFDIRPIGVDEAIREALRNEDREIAQTCWSDSFSAGNTYRRWGGVRFGGRLIDSRTRDVPASPEQSFAPIRRVGGKTGWYFANFLWRLRAALDLLVGGVGMRRGRRDPEHLAPGDVVDFWRVEDVKDSSLLRLQAEMKLPGRAWLEFEVTPLDEGGSRIRQTAIFDPIGLGGLLYWYGIYPLHALIFRGMLAGVARRASERAA